MYDFPPIINIQGAGGSDQTVIITTPVLYHDGLILDQCKAQCEVDAEALYQWMMHRLPYRTVDALKVRLNGQS